MPAGRKALGGGLSHVGHDVLSSHMLVDHSGLPSMLAGKSGAPIFLFERFLWKTTTSHARTQLVVQHVTSCTLGNKNMHWAVYPSSVGHSQSGLVWRAPAGAGACSRFSFGFGVKVLGHSGVSSCSCQWHLPSDFPLQDEPGNLYRT